MESLVTKEGVLEERRGPVISSPEKLYPRASKKEACFGWASQRWASQFRGQELSGLITGMSEGRDEAGRTPLQCPAGIWGQGSLRSSALARSKPLLRAGFDLFL